MSIPNLVSIDQEREFTLRELFFSTTDGKGIIELGNRVFTRVSGYAESELIGQPHNIIRHPEMPRCVFKLLWDYLGQKKPIAAYVKNRAKDGRYYWVVATVVPCASGYLSVRFRPSSPVFDTVQQLYRELRAVEAEVEQRDAGTRKLAIEASHSRLLQALSGLGFPDYDAFMNTFLPLEVRSRQQQIERLGHEPAARPKEVDALERRGFELLRDDVERLGSYLSGLFSDLDHFTELNRILGDKSAFVLELAGGVRLLAHNALAASHKLSGAGATLGVIARAMGDQSDESARALRALDGEIKDARTLLQGLAFRVSVAKLQNEICLTFIDECLSSGANAEGTSTPGFVGSREQSIRALTLCFCSGLQQALSSFHALDSRLQRIDSLIERLQESLRTLETVQVSGRVESSRISGAASFELLFDRVRSQVLQAKNELQEFLGAIGESRMRTQQVKSADRSLYDQAQRVSGLANSL